MNQIYARAIMPADENCRSRISYADQSRRYMGHETLKQLIATTETALQHQFGACPSVFSEYATDALLRTDAHMHLSAYLDELRVALVAMETQFEGMGI